MTFRCSTCDAMTKTKGRFIPWGKHDEVKVCTPCAKFCEKHNIKDASVLSKFLDKAHKRKYLAFLGMAFLGDSVNLSGVSHHENKKKNR